MDKTNLGNRMKMYEKLQEPKLMPGLPILVRLDGKNFSNYTRGLKRPYDPGLVCLMQGVTHKLVEYTNARIGYTQSDEITLVLYSDNPKSQVFFDGKHSKLVSVLASAATYYFNALAPSYLPRTHTSKMALFDCRVWSVPNKDEAANAVLWREIDATKNSIQMLAQEHFPHKQLQGKGRADQHDLLHSIGINWNSFPAFFKRGSYFRRETYERVLTTDELADLPEKHNARKNPDMKVVRSGVRPCNMPPFMKVINRVGVIFDGEGPITGEDNDESTGEEGASGAGGQRPSSML